jgi:S1-C subfamily serine protease
MDTSDMIEVEPTMYTQPPPELGRPRRLTIVLAAVTLFAGGIGLGWLVGSEPAADPTEVEVAASVPAETATSAPTTVPPASASDPVEEPVAAVAEVLLPSVVQIELTSGVGSGVVYDADGLILTAAHVVRGTSQVTVRLADGSRLTGTVLGSDSVSDIAVVEVDRSDLPAAELALGEEPRVGQLAVALGSPWGLNSTVTAGIVSAVNRSLDGQSMIQTDASINPGNSGGPLADRFGRVIGINVSIFTTSGASDGVGFAVPINRAYEIARAIVAGETIEPGFLGVSGADNTLGAAGALVNEVYAGSAAAGAGLRAGDLITAVDGRAVVGITDLAARIREYRPGDTVTIEFVRDGVEDQVEVTLGSR